MRILVTGAAGHLGSKLSTHLLSAGHDVIGVDRQEADKPVPVRSIDLSAFSEDLVTLCRDVETIVHLAADRSPEANWDTVIPHNLDAVLNLFAAAAQAGVWRIVFASSNWVVGGRRFGREILGAKTLPLPVSPYGMSKLMGERIGAHYAAAQGMTVICMRIGWTQWTHDNKPGPHMAMGRWGQLMWLSDRDFLDGMTAAATVPVSGFHIVNLMSNNPGMRWSLEEAKSVLGFVPKDGSAAVLPIGVRLKEAGAWLKQVGVPALMGKLIGSDW